MLFSFVIPLYNCEIYVVRCLDSIGNANIPHDDFEVIVVDDGSKDQGPELCKNYTRFKVNLFHQENSGQATARNFGLKHAKGDYVWFVDADDVLVPTAVSRLKDEIDKDDNWDMISFNYQVEQLDGIKEVCLANERLEYNSGVDYLKVFRGGYLWNRIYKRTSLTKAFVEHTSHIEDMCFNIQNILLFQKILVLNIEGYVYNRANVSSTSHIHSEEATDKANADAYRIYSLLHHDMCLSENMEVKNYLQEVLNFGVAGHVYTMVKETSYQKILSYIDKYWELGLYPIKKTNCRKANLFTYIANCKPLLYLVNKYYAISSRLNKKVD